MCHQTRYERVSRARNWINRMLAALGRGKGFGEFALFLGGGAPPQKFPIVARRSIVIGRSPSADIHIGGATVSHHHCRLEPTLDGWKIVDMQSKNGLFVNATRIREVELHDGDRVRIGWHELIYHDCRAA